MRSETRIHSELSLCFGSLLVTNLILCSLDAGQSLYLGTNHRTQIFVCIKHSSRFAECQPHFVKKYYQIQIEVSIVVQPM
jgi:hypothetical protein